MGAWLFVIPWGTTRSWAPRTRNFHGDPDSARAERADVEYLLAEFGRCFPMPPLSEAGVATTFTGVRSLLASDVASPSARSREHRVVPSGRNLLASWAGKYTTYRAIAQQTVDAVKILYVTAQPCRTTEVHCRTTVRHPPARRSRFPPTVYVSDIAHAAKGDGRYA